jgi:hypothetical protein
MSSVAASIVTKTITAAAASSSAASDRATPQGGVIEGGNPSHYDSKNPIILFIIQVCNDQHRLVVSPRTKQHPTQWYDVSIKLREGVRPCVHRLHLALAPTISSITTARTSYYLLFLAQKYFGTYCSAKYTMDFPIHLPDLC